ncbi:hypothetical protein HZH66_014772 [Vespula vulgaris]|uniref:Uncharacterized protein n=1 Tax=Vespula vulgaris TaxID=7454 RepID=A0A834IYW0_VESVU|nr:hypothetical protein HZH66_014772 [Vespula vulgaris]
MQLFRSCYHRSIVYDHVHLPRGPYVAVAMDRVSGIRGDYHHLTSNQLLSTLLSGSYSRPSDIHLDGMALDWSMSIYLSATTPLSHFRYHLHLKSLGSRCTRLYWEPPLVSPTERLSNGRPDRAARSSPSVAEFSEERRERRKINQASRPPSPSYKSGKTTKSVKG